MKEANALIHSSSPYLQQHAYNPVQWQEWSEAALKQAREENKLIIVSIGYAACHWCHVMERESFESYEVAEIMNKYFVCIKVDREERPDIDQIYMLAVQLMTGQGGWPLNAICLPNQKPVYGGTYFKKYDWINILMQLAEGWKSDPDKLEKYADRLHQGIEKAEQVVHLESPDKLPIAEFEEALAKWRRQFDSLKGGWNRAPKFPMPNQWTFWLRFAHLKTDDAAHFMVHQTLQKMAFGGIYDQLRGGFCRYSVDSDWHVPHFEKMLYDNGQLISLYAEAYKAYKDPDFENIVHHIIDWLKAEMLSPEGLFFAALDADSEGVEGKFYTWDKQEFDQLLGADASFMAEYYDIKEHGNWEEEETNVLRKNWDDEVFAQQHNLDLSEWILIKERSREILLAYRNKRVRPGLDYKCLLSWNALTIKGLADAALTFDRVDYFHLAAKAADFIWDNMRKSDHELWRNYAHGKPQISAFLDDYALYIEALISLYTYSFDKSYLDKAVILTEKVKSLFSDTQSPMFYYTPNSNEELISRKLEIMDNVIPSSNAIMASNLWRLGIYFDREDYKMQAEQMLASIMPHLLQYPSVYPNWGILMMEIDKGIVEVAVLGQEFKETLKEFQGFYFPQILFLGGVEENLPLLNGKATDQTQIYICHNHRCQLPVKTVAEAIPTIQRFLC